MTAQPAEGVRTHPDLSMLEAEAAALGDALRARSWRIGTAESCTGGLIAAVCTSVAGSSDWFECGFVTYSNASKVAMLGVDAAVIEAHGAVSEPVALAMARGVLAHSPADLAVSVTGVAGPGGGSAAKPVGTVWMALARREGATTAWRLQLPGGRSAVRGETVRQALAALHRAVTDSSL